MITTDFTLSTQGVQPPTIVQFGANVPQELARASSLVAPYVNGIDLNCGCPQSWACAETLGAALMGERALVRDLVLEARKRLRDDGWAVGKEKDIDHAKGRSISVKIRIHKDLRYANSHRPPPKTQFRPNFHLIFSRFFLYISRQTIDFIDTVLGHEQDRNIDFLTIHPRMRSTPSTTPINLDALELLTNKYGDKVPILVSGDVFSMSSLPYTSPYLPPRDDDAGRPHLPKLRGLMSARALLANPALFAGYEACPWDAVELFMNKVIRAPMPLKLVQHHCELRGPSFFLVLCLLLLFSSLSFLNHPRCFVVWRLLTTQPAAAVGEMCSPGFGRSKVALLDKKERAELHNCTNMCDVIDLINEKIKGIDGRTGLRRGGGIT